MCEGMDGMCEGVEVMCEGVVGSVRVWSVEGCVRVRVWKGCKGMEWMCERVEGMCEANV